MWKLGSSQCFTTPEVSAGFSTHETLDINLDVGSLAEKVLKDLISTSEQLPVCIEEKKYCLATLETCIDTNSLIKADKLDLYSDLFGEKIALDFTYANGHCYFSQATGKVEKTSICKNYITKLAAVVGLTENLTLENSANVRLLVSSNELIPEDVMSNLKDIVICDHTPRMLARSIIDTQLLIELTDSQTLLDGIFSLVGRKDTATLLSDFLGRPFHPGETSAAENKKLLAYVDVLF